MSKTEKKIKDLNGANDELTELQEQVKTLEEEKAALEEEKAALEEQSTDYELALLGNTLVMRKRAGAWTDLLKLMGLVGSQSDLCHWRIKMGLW